VVILSRTFATAEEKLAVWQDSIIRSVRRGDFNAPKLYEVLGRHNDFITICAKATNQEISTVRAHILSRG
jgi:hypothetical protein